MTALQGLHPVRVVMGTVYPSPFLPRCPSGERCEPLIPPRHAGWKTKAISPKLLDNFRFRKRHPVNQPTKGEKKEEEEVKKHVCSLSAVCRSWEREQTRLLLA